MYQSENGKILCFLHNIDTSSTYLYYEKAPRIGYAVANSSFFRKFQREVDLIAYDDVSGLLAIYSFRDGNVSKRMIILFPLVMKYNFDLPITYF